MSEELSDGFETKKCLECEGQMVEIRVIDHSHGGMQAELAYSSTDRTPSWFTSYYKEVGKLGAYMCTKCGAVRFYARPFKNN